MAIVTNKVLAVLYIVMISMVMSLPPIYACTHECSGQNPPSNQPPSHGGGSRWPWPKIPSPFTNPPIIIVPPIIVPPIILPPPIFSPPAITPSPPSRPNCPPGRGSGGGGGGTSGGMPSTCPINALKLGLCVDVLGGLIHIGIGDPVENVCCPLLRGLLEIEAAICLCATIRLKLLNLNIFIPLALQALITCGITPPPGFVCPPLV